MLLYVKLCISTYCNAKSVGILGLRVFKQILSMFTSKHKKTCKTAVFIAFTRKAVHFYVLQCQILSIFTMEKEKICKTALSSLLYLKLCISTYCNAKSIGILGLSVFKEMLSIFTLKREKPCKTAVFIAFTRKTVYFYVVQCHKRRNLGFMSL